MWYSECQSGFWKASLSIINRSEHTQFSQNVFGVLGPRMHKAKPLLPYLLFYLGFGSKVKNQYWKCYKQNFIVKPLEEEKSNFHRGIPQSL